jgi:HD-GYP domain-containing protein (c-di-GMP phosphodiesterase class II)
MSGVMALMPNLTEQELLADTLRQADGGLDRREQVIEIIFGLAFAGAAAGLWWLDPPGKFSFLPAALCWLVMVLATRVRFDTPFGFTVATQLAFVPLLFAMPATAAPVAVAVALVAARLPELLRGLHPQIRLVKEIGNSWFVIGPVAVFSLAHVPAAAAAPALLLAALLAQFAVDFAASTVRLSLERAASFSAQLRETWVYGIDAALSVIAIAVAEDLHRTPIVALAPVPLLAVLALFARERHQRLRSLIELNDAYRGTALVLGDFVEADDNYTGQHSKGVVQLALEVGTALRLAPEQLRNLEFGAMLHDVGKIAIPKAIINKPGKLDRAEWDIIETHTLEGQRVLDRIGGFMRNVGRIVRSHHERWDGRGYPDGLYGRAIPLESRIIACCDAWHAMRTDRSYRKALSHEVARAELLANAGHQFDAGIVTLLLNVVESGSPSGRVARSVAPGAPVGIASERSDVSSPS